MTEFIDRLTDGPVKTWYKSHAHPIVMNDMATTLEGKGYTLNPESGLFLRPLYKSHLSFTLIDIAFLIPTDLHYHRDVEETVKVIGGQGAMLLAYPLPERISTNLTKGNETSLLPHVQHAFRPNRGTCLELRIACDGILDPSKEVRVQRFDQVPEWADYFHQNR